MHCQRNVRCSRYSRTRFSSDQGVVCLCGRNRRVWLFRNMYRSPYDQHLRHRELVEGDIARIMVLVTGKRQEECTESTEEGKILPSQDQSLPDSAEGNSRCRVTALPRERTDATCAMHVCSLPVTVLWVSGVRHQGPGHTGNLPWRTTSYNPRYGSTA